MIAGCQRPTSDHTSAQYAKFQDAVETLHDLAPAEIEADVETVKKGLADFLALAEEYDFDFEKLFTAAQADPALSDRLDATLTSAEAEAADARLTAYGEQVCGITDTTGG